MSGLSSLSNGWGKYKGKATDGSSSNQNVEKTCNPKLTFTERKKLFIKRVQKNELWMQLTQQFLNAFYYLFNYSPNKYKSPNHYKCVNKLLHVSYIFIVFRCVIRTSITFKTKLFATLVKGYLAIN